MTRVPRRVQPAVLAVQSICPFNALFFVLKLQAYEPTVGCAVRSGLGLTNAVGPRKIASCWD
jgi:hypothetical protein